MKTPLILASSSPFRQSILKKLMLPFASFSPDVDEQTLEGESAQQLVARLSESKAKAAIAKYQQGVVIGSDQVALFNGEILGKPHNKENAIKQLSLFSNNRVTFLTGLTVFDIESGKTVTEVVPFYVYFRQLTQAQISNYCDAETPYNCAGSFKSEGLGICLFDKLEGEDPNTLIGLPLIQLTKTLLTFGIDVLAEQSGQQ
ncbi:MULTISPECIES: Maf family protein [Pseudoalteromonas]|uniref:Maf family protein n=1 Tax=Pseudoalteromonas TaxID=53246 RepID=UPI00029ABE19|nr:MULTISPECIES: nucleoside triphosphate pyrophosphatase [Pseudoalteromonas]AUJ70284.1 Maf-like protein YceF [Pseudoalteromonas sp. NC201]MCF2827001.1 Maf family nucleotide pyrophosphatase [Pseudoalteromonas sp. OF5H-5]MCF2832449.1 Maf family nucleotide pyrophosphatase [Pseudoalteromonas sp. DL2-H6]MCF2923871.1 Maf family nucleotide pyrophosphatase [Pseudoalteromonas sp. DL2-H1]MCF7514020.1 Maf family nucleotide pyrophosphatase [Pseudoalteromonas sp. L7]